MGAATQDEGRGPEELDLDAIELDTGEVELDALPGAADSMTAGGGGVTGDFGGLLGGGMTGSLADAYGPGHLPVDTTDAASADPIGKLFGHPPAEPGGAGS